MPSLNAENNIKKTSEKEYLQGYSFLIANKNDEASTGDSLLEHHCVRGYDNTVMKTLEEAIWLSDNVH